MILRWETVTPVAPFPCSVQAVLSFALSSMETIASAVYLSSCLKVRSYVFAYRDFRVGPMAGWLLRWFNVVFFALRSVVEARPIEGVVERS